MHDTCEFALGLDDIYQARARMGKLVRKTPLLSSLFLPEILFKPENLQQTGAFKARTAANQILQLSEKQRARGIVTSSSGNFGQAVAYVANRIGLDAKIVMMESCSRLKVELTRKWGAEVVFCANRYEDRVRTVREIAEAEGRNTVHPFDHPNGIAGNATVGLEITEQFWKVQNVAVPISGGGLLAGISWALKSLRPEVKVWGVQPELSNATRLSFQAGQRVTIGQNETIADGLRVTSPGELTFSLIQKYVDDVVTVSEDSIREATRHFVEKERIVVEPSGAVTLAAFLEEKLPAKATVLVLSGGNILPQFLSELWSAETELAK